jgi:hypothetical protein
MTPKLSDRVERLTAPDREIDAEVRKAIAGDFWFCGDDERAYMCGACCVPVAEMTQFPGCGAPLGIVDERTSYPSDWRDDDRLPFFTASIDAAMTAVPEGCGWIAGWGQTRPDEPMGGARITRNARFVGYHANYDAIAEAEAATPALALLTAALRARGL